MPALPLNLIKRMHDLFSIYQISKSLSHTFLVLHLRNFSVQLRKNSVQLKIFSVQLKIFSEMISFLRKIDIVFPVNPYRFLRKFILI